MPRRRSATLVLLAMLAMLAMLVAVRGPARAEDAPPPAAPNAPPTAPPAPTAAPAAEPRVEQGAAPWPDLVALTRWFDETCTVVEELVGEQFQRRPTLRVVTRWELELVLRELLAARNPGEAGRGALEQAAIHHEARRNSGTQTFAYDARGHVVWFAPANRVPNPTRHPSSWVGDRIRLVGELVLGWDAERFPWARPGFVASGFEASASVEAVLAGHAAWVGERAAARWGAPDAVARYVEWIGTWDRRTQFVPWLDGLEFFRAVFAREGEAGVRRVLDAPPRRLRDVVAPDAWTHPSAAAPPYLDLERVVNAMLAPVPRADRRLTRPTPEAPYDGVLRGARVEDAPVDALEASGSFGPSAWLLVSILQFRDAAAADRFAAVATETEPIRPSVDLLWDLDGTAVDAVLDGAGVERRARGLMLRRARVRGDLPTKFSHRGHVVVGTLVGRVRSGGGATDGPDADALLAALEVRLRALARGEPVEPVASFPPAPAALPQVAPAGPGAVARATLDVTVRRPDGTPVVGAEVRVDRDTPRRAVFGSLGGAERTDAAGRVALELKADGGPRRVEAVPPPGLETFAPVATTVPDLAPVVLTLPEGWVATGRVVVGERAAPGARVAVWVGAERHPDVEADHDGSFRVPSLPAGPVALRAWVERDEIILASGVAIADPARPTASLSCAPWTEARARVAVRVRGPGLEPVAGLRLLSLERSARERPSIGVSSRVEDAEARFDRDSLGLFVAGASLADGRRFAPRIVPTPTPGVDPVVVELEPAVRTTGRVVDATGAGVAGARVEGGVIGVPWAATEAVTEASGAFRLDGLGAGPCWLAVVSTPPSHQPTPPVRAVAGAADVVLRVDRRADAVVTVADPDGAPVVGADVRFTPAPDPDDRDAPETVLRATTDAAGRATLGACPERATGTFEVRPPPDRALAAVVRKRTRVGGVERVTLPVAYTVTGYVGRDGSDASDARVSLHTRSATAPDTWSVVEVRTGKDGRFVVPHVPMGPAALRLIVVTWPSRRPTLRYDAVAVVSPDRPDVVLRPPKLTDVVFTVQAVAGRTMYLHANGPDLDRAELTADAHGRFEWVEAADVPHELWIPPTPDDPRVAYLPDYVPGPTPPALVLTAPGVAKFRRPAFEGGQVDGATVEDAWVVGPLGMAFAARLVGEGRFEVDGLPPGTFPAVVRVRTGKGWVRCTGPVTVGAPEVELPRP